MIYHSAKSIRERGGISDALQADARRFIKKRSSVKFQAVTISLNITVTVLTTEQNDPARYGNK